ncbi:hypothetical protein [Kutzneria sp. 744]|uniref:hypothetical protein n=1 Tax=Kutzneria sp. (strain 744) TaxID=345341 RepID=UPI0005B8D89B|nr:hypothetical protein [Kutzneria sp. 744]
MGSVPVDSWLSEVDVVVALSEWLTPAATATATAPPTPTSASAAVITAALRIPCSRAFMSPRCAAELWTS